jgi:MFS transporter, DHA2 family, multidrug resistance protein
MSSAETTVGNAQTTAVSAQSGQAGVQAFTGPRWLVFIAMVMGMFMAVLDIQIVASSLGQIQAGLAASPQEISYVQSSYLIAEVLMIPLTGFLQRALSLRLLFALSSLGFALASLLCATATSIEQMLIYRALQGFIGGAMIPSVYTAMFLMFGRQRQVGLTVFVSMMVTLAPTIGPTLGGVISTNYGWEWLFLINVIPGIIIAMIVFNARNLGQPNFSLLRQVDIASIVFMALFLGALQYVLEEGAVKNWFEADEIIYLTGVAIFGAIGFFIRCFTAKLPAINLHPFTNANFATGALLGVIFGIVLFGVTFIYPLYLGRIAQLNSEQIGFIMSVSGACMVLGAPFAGILTKYVDTRYLVCIGFIMLALSSWLTHTLTFEWRFAEFFWPQVLRGFGLILCIVSLTQTAFATLPNNQLGDASGLFTLMRNTGGAIGLAIINTILTERFYLHLSNLSQNVQQGREEVQSFVDGLGQRMADVGVADGTQMAMQNLLRLISREAQVLSYADAFTLLAYALTIVAFLPLFMKKPSSVVDVGEVH